MQTIQVCFSRKRKSLFLLFKGLMCNISSTGITRFVGAPCWPNNRMQHDAGFIIESQVTRLCFENLRLDIKKGSSYGVAPSHLTQTLFAVRFLAIRCRRVLHTGPLSLRTVGCAWPVGWDVTYVRRDESQPHQPWRDMYLRVCNKISCVCFIKASLSVLWSRSWDVLHRSFRSEPLRQKSVTLHGWLCLNSQ